MVHEMSLVRRSQNLKCFGDLFSQRTIPNCHTTHLEKATISFGNDGRCTRISAIRSLWRAGDAGKGRAIK